MHNLKHKICKTRRGAFRDPRAHPITRPLASDPIQASLRFGDWRGIIAGSRAEVTDDRGGPTETSCSHHPTRPTYPSRGTLGFMIYLRVLQIQHLVLFPGHRRNRISGANVGTLSLLVTKRAQATREQSQKEGARHTSLLLPSSSSFHSATYGRVGGLPSIGMVRSAVAEAFECQIWGKFLQNTWAHK